MCECIKLTVMNWAGKNVMNESAMCLASIENHGYNPMIPFHWGDIMSKLATLRCHIALNQGKVCPSH